MLNDCTVRIRRLQNGWTVSMTDPAIVKQNDMRSDAKDGCCAVAWKDPDVTYTFADAGKAMDFIRENIEKAFPVDEYTSTFDKAAKGKS